MLARKLDKVVEFEFQYSVCTLVTNRTEYDEMIDSFIKAGFITDDCEFIFSDNTSENEYDAYSALNRFLKEARGRYIIICHQDILLSFEDRNALTQRLTELDAIDPNWAICGNGGGVAPNNVVYKISYSLETISEKGSLPQKVYSLDENFVVVKSAASLVLSKDLAGFHLYATDLCIIADILGYSCYVIDFRILHKSLGNPGEDFIRLKKDFQSKYRRALRGRFIQTTITQFYISGSRSLNFIFNLSPVIFLVRMYNGLKKRLN